MSTTSYCHNPHPHNHTVFTLYNIIFTKTNMPPLPPITLAYILRTQNQQCWDNMYISFWKEFVFRKKDWGLLVYTSHTHTQIRRKKCGDYMKYLSFKIICIQRKKTGDFGVYVTYTCTNQTKIMWGLGLETRGCNVGTIWNLFLKRLWCLRHTYTQIWRKKVGTQ